MSDNSSGPVSTRSATAIRQDIADYVLNHSDELSEVPGVKEFVEEHGRLTKEIAESEERLERLAKAKAEYEPLEQRVTSCRKTLKDAEAELTKLHRPLGKAAFKAFIEGDLEDQPLFADRLTTHKRVQELQKERDDLAPATDAGMAQKAKAKAQELAFTGKIKIEEMKVGGLETEVGRKVVEDKLDESVRCDSTNEHLGKIAELREGIANSTEMVNDSEAAREEAATNFCKSVPMDRLEGTESLNTEVTKCSKHVRSSQSSFGNSARVLIAALHDVEQSTLPDPLSELVQTFSKQNVNERLPFGEWYRRRFFKVVSQPNPQSGFYQYLLWSATMVVGMPIWYLIDGTAEEPDDPKYLEVVRHHQQTGLVERISGWWNSMSRRGKIITGVGAGLASILIMNSQGIPPDYEKKEEAEATVVTPVDGHDLSEEYRQHMIVMVDTLKQQIATGKYDTDEITLGETVVAGTKGTSIFEFEMSDSEFKMDVKVTVHHTHDGNWTISEGTVEVLKADGDGYYKPQSFASLDGLHQRLGVGAPVDFKESEKTSHTIDLYAPIYAKQTGLTEQAIAHELHLWVMTFKLSHFRMATLMYEISSLIDRYPNGNPYMVTIMQKTRKNVGSSTGSIDVAENTLRVLWISKHKGL